ncbi:hypothetical protein Lal_00003682 [Lupinus albus]|nr:hypothetical protein Lal_00003682 [Lupinus albus]
MENNPPPPPRLRPPRLRAPPPPPPQSLPILWYGEQDQQHRNQVYLPTILPIIITLITPVITFRITITQTTTILTITRNNYDIGLPSDRARRLQLIQIPQGHGVFLPNPRGLYTQLSLPTIIIITTTTFTVHLVLNPDEPIGTMFGIDDRPSFLHFPTPLPRYRRHYEDCIRGTELPFFITFNFIHIDNCISICILISCDSITISAYTHMESIGWVALISSMPPSITAI